jgi:asparagine synthase (glutamine-hydrolysing)
MGAFLLVRKSRDSGIEETESKYRDSLNVFQKMGLRLNGNVSGGDFTIFVFHKYNFDVDNLVQFNDGQFAIATGTLIYNRKTGRRALEELFHDFSENGKCLANTLGQYCAIVFKNGKLYLFNDYTGLYHVYSDTTRSLISNSFLAVLKGLRERNVSTQELYEYVINGACFGDVTLMKEISLLSSQKIWQLFPAVSPLSRAAPARRFDRNTPLDNMVQDLGNDLIDYFDIIKSNFGDNICSALSGGVHTRLMLGLMRKTGIQPGYLYVYGDENNTAGRDANVIQIVKAIARGEGLSVDYIDKNKFPGFGEEEYRESLEKRYYLNDGLGHETGIFDNGADLYYRLARTEKGKLQLNGGGGEVFRNYWKLPDRSYTIKSFFKARYDRMNYSIFTDCFDYGAHFSALQEKVKASLNTDKKRIDRLQIELLQPEFDSKYWMGSNNSINNILSYSLTPFGDTPFQYRACDIPLKYKDYHSFESALMRFIDPALARYPTSHGIDLLNNRFKLRPKVKYLITLNTPLWLKAYIRKNYWHQRTEILRLRGNRETLPFYLSRDYLSKIFPSHNLGVSQYIHTDKITDPDVLSRVLTAELVITNCF